MSRVVQSWQGDSRPLHWILFTLYSRIHTKSGRAEGEQWRMPTPSAAAGMAALAIGNQLAAMRDAAVASSTRAWASRQVGWIRWA